MGLGKKSFSVGGAECGFEAVLLGAVTSVGGFLFGYDTGQISSMLLFTDFIDRFGQDQVDANGNTFKAFNSMIQALIVSLMSIGTLIGALSGAYTADWWGRRKSMSFGVFMFVIGNIIQITAMNSWVHLMMGRFVAGLGVGNLSVGVPMYQSECTPRQLRGPVVASYQLMITIGILISNIINYGVRNIQDSDASWRIVIGLGIFFSLFLGFGIFAVPESPRWLGGQGRWEDARMSLARLRGKKDDPHCALVEEDMKEMYSKIEEQRQVGTSGWFEIFTGGVVKLGRRSFGKPTQVRKLVYRTFLGGAIHFLQQWTGVNYFFYYGATIFRSAGVEDPILTQLILGAVNVVTTLPGLWIVERFGRRWPLFIGACWQAAWLAIFAGMGVGLPPQQSSTSGSVMIVAACMFIASFAMTWGPMAWVVIGETFPLRSRAKQASFATACNWLGNFMIAFFSPLADAGIGFNFGWVFVVTNVLAALLVWFFLYETKSLSLENVDVMYSSPEVTPRNSTKWVPEGYITRREKDPAFHDDAGADDATRVDSSEFPRGGAAGKKASMQQEKVERVAQP